jgi:hypothetical protein
MITVPFGFLIRGATTEARRLVDHVAAFRAFAACDERAAVDQEAYLSAFAFGEDFRQLLDDTGSCRGFTGACWSAWHWFDIDAADNVQRALDGARRLAAGLLERYQLDDKDLLAFFSGFKGFHVGLSTLLWNASPSPDFHRHAKRFAEVLAADLRVSIDLGVYDRVRPFRAPNSKHTKTGLHKRRLSFDELMKLSLDGILQLAATPAPFELPTPPGPCEQAAADWQAAMTWVCQQTEVKSQRRAAAASGTPTLNRSTLVFIRDGADQGDRHRLLFSAAANLSEFGCPPALAHALLSEAALDSGLPPADVRRQIDCGLAYQGEGMAVAPAPPPNTAAPSPSLVAELQNRLAILWARPALTPASGQSEGNTTGPPAGDDRGDAWENPADRLFSAPPSDAGPYAAGP